MSFSLFEQQIISLNFGNDSSENSLQRLFQSANEKFRKILTSYVIFNLIFYVLIAIEFLYLIFHVIVLIQNFVLAIHLALLFTTVFSYLTLRLYFQTRKTEHCLALKQEFVDNCRSIISDQKTPLEKSMKVADACCKLANELDGLEYRLYVLPSWLAFLTQPLEKLSCLWHWQDVLLMEELLLGAASHEYITLIHSDPTEVAVHAGLANIYVMLSGLYMDPRTVEGLPSGHRWIPPYKYTESFKRKFRKAAERAIEEFTILKHYAPNDPWVHVQLAYSYRDLQMPEYEIQEYETILKLSPNDQETLFKLGKLYFEQGLNAKGLQVYEALKKSHHKQAETLIRFYGS